jgi:hypothetical protein
VPETGGSDRMVLCRFGFVSLMTEDGLTTACTRRPPDLTPRGRG